ncbi:MAG: glycosyltransferase family 4 protein [Bacteroidia bacterium]
MKILQICNKIPYPPKDGGSLAMHQLSESLFLLGNDVKVLAMDTFKQGFSETEWDENYRQKFHPEYVFMDIRIKALDAMLNLFSDKSYNLERFHSQAFEDKLQAVLGSAAYDLIILESLYVTPYLALIRKHSRATIIYRAHNIEHVIWKRLQDGERNPFRKKYLRLLSERLKNYEDAIVNEFDGVAAITPGDAAYFRSTGCQKPIAHIPFGIEAKPLRTVCVDKNALFFIGSMDWMPNLESLRWVLDHLWDKLVALHPDIRLYVAGRNMPPWLQALEKKQVVMLGDVKDAEAFMDDKSILLAPYFSGGGMRVKFIEAMLQKKIIVTTAIGAEGIAGRDGEHFLIAESEAGMLAIIDKCLKDAEWTAYIGSNARSLVLDQYNSRKIAQRLVSLYASIRA